MHMYAVRMTPTLNESSVLQHFKHGNVAEIHNGIMFNFYPGLPHIAAKLLYTSVSSVTDKGSPNHPSLPR